MLPFPNARRKSLRVALLTMMELAEAGVPRAFLRVGGLAVARQQLGLALALQCERMVCLAKGMQPELIDLQHAVEAAGVQFHVISGPRALLGLVTAADELVVLGDGLFASVPEATAILEQGQAVLVQPVEPGMAAGFERIDINHAAAGAMRIPGRLVEQIAELPSDCDVASTLQRIALQAGVRQRPIPSSNNGHVFWTLVRSDAEAHALEPQWVHHRTRAAAPLSPTRALALMAVRGFGPTLLHAGSGAAHLSIAAGVAALIALGAGWFKLAMLGLGFCAVGWILREIAVLLERIEGDALGPQRKFDGKSLYGWLLDAIIIGVAGWGAIAVPWQTMPDRLFPPLMLVALLRIIPRTVKARWTVWLEDRAVLALAIALAIGFGVGSEAIHAGAVLAALAGIALPGLGKRLTRP